MKKIAFVTDMHLDEPFTIDNGIDARRNFELVLNDIKARQIDEVIIGGDIGDTGAYPWFYEQLKDFKLDILLGNHDKFDPAAACFAHDFNDPVNEWYYFKDDEYYRYIFLDSSAELLSETQFNFLKDKLDTDRKVIIFIHHPIFKVDTMVDEQYPLRGREKLQELLLSSNKDITIFSGHYHLNDEQTIGKIKQVITPATSIQFLKNSNAMVLDKSTFGYRIIRVAVGAISTEYISFQHKN
jgi:Icc protein